MKYTIASISFIFFSTLYTLLPSCCAINDKDQTFKISGEEMTSVENDFIGHDTLVFKDSVFFFARITSLIVATRAEKKSIFGFDGALMACRPDVKRHFEQRLDSFGIVADSAYGTFTKGQDISHLFRAMKADSSLVSLPEYTNSVLQSLNAGPEFRFPIQFSSRLTVPGTLTMHALIVLADGRTLIGKRFMVVVK
jgi:hypothetical protein